MNKLKIEIKNRWTGDVLFEYEKENNTVKDTLIEAVKERANLEGADLEGANLYGANLEGANLEGAYLKGTYLYGADLEGADLEGANLYRANLKGADLERANLKGTYLKGTYLYGANLEGADLEGANLEGANLEGAYLYLSDEEIEQDKIIDNFEKNTGLKLTETYINHDIIPTRWNCFWRNGLIIRKYEVAPVVKEVKKMTVSEICKELGYEIEIIKEN